MSFPDGLDAEGPRSVADGSIVAVVLRPDVANPGLSVKMDPYLENFHLPFVCTDGSSVIAANRQALRPYDEHGSKLLLTGFMYVDGPPVYLSYTIDPARSFDDESTRLKVLGRDGYRYYDFVYRDEAALVWDIADGRTAGLAETLEAGKTHHAVFEDRFGYCRSYPIDIFYFFEADGSFSFLTQATVLPRIFLDPTKFFEILHTKFGGAATLQRQDFGLSATTDQASTYFEIASDGRIRDIAGQEHVSPNLLRVYAA